MDNTDLKPKRRRGRPPGGGKWPGSGRKVGTPNHLSVLAREHINAVLAGQPAKMAASLNWLATHDRRAHVICCARLLRFLLPECSSVTSEITLRGTKAMTDAELRLIASELGDTFDQQPAEEAVLLPAMSAEPEPLRVPPDDAEGAAAPVPDELLQRDASATETVGAADGYSKLLEQTIAEPEPAAPEPSEFAIYSEKLRVTNHARLLAGQLPLRWGDPSLGARPEPFSGAVRPAVGEK